MKYYFVPEGVMGWIEEEGRYMLFASLNDYIEYLEDEGL